LFALIDISVSCLSIVDRSGVIPLPHWYDIFGVLTLHFSYYFPFKCDKKENFAISHGRRQDDWTKNLDNIFLMLKIMFG